ITGYRKSKPCRGDAANKWRLVQKLLLIEIVRVRVHLDSVARVIVNANHGRETKSLRYRERAPCRKRVVMSTNFLYAHPYCGFSARDIGTHVSKVCNASKICAMSDLICVTSSRSFLSSFASSVTAVSWCSTACSILPLPFASFKSRSLPCCFVLLFLFGVLRIFVHPLWLLQLWDRTCPAARLPIDQLKLQ